MKYYIFTFLNFFLAFSAIAQSDIESEIDRLKAMVEQEDYRSAMILGDELIGDGVKEGFEKHAGEVYFYRGVAKFHFEIFDDAIVDFKQAVAFDKTLTDAYIYISQIYYDLGSFSSALENVIYFLNDHPESTHGLALKSRCLLELGEPMAAKIIIQKALALKSSEPELYYVRSAVNHALGENKKACSDAHIALKFGYEDAQHLVSSVCENDKK